jgi:hypothetical protein
VYGGNGDNGIGIYSENEADRQACLQLGGDHGISLRDNDSEDYVAGG